MYDMCVCVCILGFFLYFFILTIPEELVLEALVERGEVEGSVLGPNHLDARLPE
jgi:hypothetical protein